MQNLEQLHNIKNSNVEKSKEKVIDPKLINSLSTTDHMHTTQLLRALKQSKAQLRRLN